MAKLNKLFDDFLGNINPDPDAVAYAQEAHKPVRECLEKVDDFKQYVEDSFLYGSYKRQTAVGDIKDVDIVLLTIFDLSDKKNTPKSVLRKLKAALGRCYDDPENPQYQRRSIRIDEPLPDKEDVEMTLDIIPAVVVTNENERLKVPDREVDKWIWTHPRGHLEFTTQLNDEDHSKGRFVPLVKIMKWWWKYQCEIRQPDVERPKPKGFWVECLTAENFDPDQKTYADHFITVLQSVSEEYGDAEEVPELDDPALDGETIKTNMTMEEFGLFMEAVDDCLNQAKTARDTKDKLESSEQWREIFGDAFPLYDEEETSESRTIAKHAVLGKTSHAQELRWPEKLQKRYKVRIDAHLYVGKKRLSGLNSNGRVIPGGLNIRYTAKTRAGGDCEIHWQVVNTGKHAENDGGQRGEFFKAKMPSGSPSANPRINWEYTRYTGKHWIECFVIKDGICVGRSGRFYVNIKNQSF